MHQILPVYKPIGLSTFDLIRRYKRENNLPARSRGSASKIGHAGTLDVFADGLVLLLLGTATKDFDQFQTYPKTYRAAIRLGASSTTLDIEGNLTNQKNPPRPDREIIEAVLKEFIGTINQSVPAFSAAKHQGQPLYKLARQGRAAPAKSKPVTIHALQLLAYKYPLVTLEATVSSGTYIRQLTYDIFKKLDLDSFLFALTRTAIGPFSLKNVTI